MGRHFYMSQEEIREDIRKNHNEFKYSKVGRYGRILCSC